MMAYIAEAIGTAILLLLGNGVVANVVLARTKGHGAGWIVITFGWGMALFVAVFCVAPASGAHLNPAVTIAMASAAQLAWVKVPGYIVAQFVGAMVGAALVYAFYLPHFRVSDDADAKLACFSTGPNIRSTVNNFFSEMIGTFMLVFPIFMMAEPTFSADSVVTGRAGAQETVTIGLGTLGAVPVGLLLFAIGLSLGGTTGFAINPARDLGPRLIHALLPIPGKRDSDWAYAWLPVVAPIVGGLLAALVAVSLG